MTAPEACVDFGESTMKQFQESMLHLQLQGREMCQLGTCRKARPGKHLSSARKAVSAAWPLAGLSWRYSAAYFTCRWAENQ